MQISNYLWNKMVYFFFQLNSWKLNFPLKRFPPPSELPVWKQIFCFSPILESEWNVCFELIKMCWFGLIWYKSSAWGSCSSELLLPLILGSAEQNTSMGSLHFRLPSHGKNPFHMMCSFQSDTVRIWQHVICVSVCKWRILPFPFQNSPIAHEH